MLKSLIEVRIGEVENDELPVEVWVGISKNEDGNGGTAQRVLDTRIPITLPIKGE